MSLNTVYFDNLDEEELLLSSMDWTKPEYSNQEIDHAGIILIDKKSTKEEHAVALKIIDNFKASHNFPLNCFQIWLRNNAKLIDPKCLVVQRIKRLSSIRHKLQRMKKRSLRLSEMQDIGGCRAVVANIDYVRQLEEKYAKSRIRHKLAYKDDYIKEPRKSGYRSLHLIYEYYSDRADTYNGKRVEIQLRTPLQHAWATAVEAVDTFTNQVLKAGGGEEEWRRFFKLVGTAIAMREGSKSHVPDTPNNKHSLQTEIKNYREQIAVIRRLKLYGETLNYLQKHLKLAKYFVLKLDSLTHFIEVSGYKEEKAGSEAVAKIEKEENKNIDAVLVSTEEHTSLRRAYPNYFLDIKAFINYLDVFLKT